MMSPNYGDIDLTRQDISGMRCWSMDMRDVCGGKASDESKLVSSGVFRLSVCGFADGEIPIGEIRIIWKGLEVSVVGHPTGREGIVEITPEHLLAASEQAEYMQTLLAWIEGECT